MKSLRTQLGLEAAQAGADRADQRVRPQARIDEDDREVSGSGRIRVRALELQVGEAVEAVRASQARSRGSAE